MEQFRPLVKIKNPTFSVTSGIDSIRESVILKQVKADKKRMNYQFYSSMKRGGAYKWLMYK